jgi:hypothetical protein
MKLDVKRWLWWSIAGIALLLVFALYTQPDFMVTVAEQVWACF